MDRIIVGYDGSEQADAALRWAVDEADRLGRDVLVLHSWRDPALALSPLGAMTADPTAEERRLELQLDAVVEALAADHPSVKVAVEGTNTAPVAAITSAADADDLIVVGARGRGGFGSLKLGSVSNKLAREALAPVVVVRSAVLEPDSAPVVAGVDGTPGGRRALRWAAEFAARRGVRLRVVMAWSYLLPEDEEGEAAFRPNYTHAQAQEVLERIVASELGEVTDQVHLEAPCNLAADAILQRSADAQLVVVGASGSRRRGPLGLGSISQQVLQHAACPVAVVRPPAD